MKKLIVIGLVIAMSAMGAAAFGWAIGINVTPNSNGGGVATNQFDGVSIAPVPGAMASIVHWTDGVKALATYGDTSWTDCPVTIDFIVGQKAQPNPMTIYFESYDLTDWTCSPCYVFDAQGQLVYSFDMATGGSFEVASAVPADVDLDGNFSGGEVYTLVCGVPEPGSMVALGTGLVGLVGFGIRRRK